MISPTLKLNIEHLLTPQEYTEHPHVLEFGGNDWKYWPDLEKAVFVNWRFKTQLAEPSMFYIVHFFSVTCISLSLFREWL